jgi:hypothetical protein
MAKFSAELPKDLIDQFKSLADGDAKKMMTEMVDAGAEIAKADMQANMKKVFKSTKGLEDCLAVKDATEITDGVGKLVGFDGYFVNEQGKTVPAGLVAYAREYGTSSGEQKKPFIRKSFKKAKITKAMLKVQERYIKDE